MCGLVGVAGNLVQRDVNIFKQLLHADYLRGQDSTGIGSIMHDGTVRVLKLPVSPESLLNLKRSDDVVKMSSKVLIGHNRAATRGVVNIVNSHPFWTGRFMVAHNGTLDYSCLKDLEKNIDGNTDSEQLANTIQTLGSIKDALALASGAWALSIYDDEENTINLVRNDQRPLYYAKAEDGDTLYWASEAHMLRWILERNNLKFGGKIFEVPTDVILTWAVPTSKEIFADKPARLAAKGKRVTNFQSGHQHHSQYAAWEDNWYNQQGRSAANRSGSSTGASGSSTGATNVVDGGFRARQDGSHAPEYSAADVRKMRFDKFDDIKYEIYALGFSDAGEGININPFDYRTDYDKWSQYCDGHQAGVDVKKANEKKAQSVKLEGVGTKIDKTLPFLLGDGPDTPPIDAPDPVDTKSNIILVGELKEDKSKKSTLYNRRPGPNGRDITIAAFRNLTKSKCGWCENPILDTDQGKFGKIPQYGSLFVCEDCLTTDPNIINDFEEKRA